MKSLSKEEKFIARILFTAGLDALRDRCHYPTKTITCEHCGVSRSEFGFAMPFSLQAYNSIMEKLDLPHGKLSPSEIVGILKRKPKEDGI